MKAPRNHVIDLKIECMKRAVRRYTYHGSRIKCPVFSMGAHTKKQDILFCYRNTSVAAIQ